ncbi:MAG: hypoxanthine phosphoribosyltransferase [Chloroflexota bacterium]|nr:hypoxanthine phosphoribosyltransferase [Chloroflexota bacterium]MDE2959890.1 hypoxanthine phosphoribosyltransferase [Chloroflexota bacterium]
MVEAGHGGLTLLIPEDELRAGVATLAREIDRDYATTGVVIVCVLKGAAVFTADLLRILRAEVHRLEFVRASSYGSGTQSSGDVRVTGTLDTRYMAGQHVLIVDDIADTGHTGMAVKDYIRSLGPASLRYCTLLDKPERREVEVQYDYVGFTIPNHFVVGYGMDFDERYRGLPAIYYFPDP